MSTAAWIGKIKGTGELRCRLRRLATDDGGLQSFPHNRQGVQVLSTNILRYKESDRLNAIMVELTKLDAAVNVSDDGDTLTIVPARQLQPAAIDTYDDHRMAIALLVDLGRTKSHHHGPWLRVENMAAILL